MPTRERPSPGAALRAHRTLLTVVLVVTVTLVATTLLGGWARSTPAGPVTAAPGEPVDAQPFRFTLDSAQASYVVGDREADPDRAFVVVEGSLAVTGDVSVSSTTLGDAVAADLSSSYDAFGDPAERPEPAIVVAADDESLLGLGPGLTYDVRLVYVVDEAAVPASVGLTLLRHVRRPSALDGEPGWYDATPAARVRLDVAPLPAQRPEPEGF